MTWIGQHPLGVAVALLAVGAVSLSINPWLGSGWLFLTGVVTISTSPLALASWFWRRYQGRRRWWVATTPALVLTTFIGSFVGGAAGTTWHETRDLRSRLSPYIGEGWEFRGERVDGSIACLAVCLTVSHHFVVHGTEAEIVTAFRTVVFDRGQYFERRQDDERDVWLSTNGSDGKVRLTISVPTACAERAGCDYRDVELSAEQ